MEAQNSKLNNSDHMVKVIAKAAENAKAKNARLRHLKDRNENYLAEQKEEYETDDEKTPEL
jgi:hypothetical protein